MNRLRLFIAVAVLVAPLTAESALLIFNSNVPGTNTTTRAAWLAAIGTGSPQYRADFEAGFTNGQNVSGVPGLFPGQLIIQDTSVNEAIIRSGPGIIGGSNPVGAFAVTQNEVAFLRLDFAAQPVDYVGGLDIDQDTTAVVVTFVDGTTTSFTLDPTGGNGDSAEFFGLYRNDQPRIVRVDFNANGDGRWGLDNIEFGRISEPGSLALLGLGFAAFGVVRRATHRR
jgi:hypothetical protein